MKTYMLLALFAFFLQVAAVRSADATSFILRRVDLPAGVFGPGGVFGTNDYLLTETFSERFDQQSVQIFDFEGSHSPASFVPPPAANSDPNIIQLAANGQPLHNLGTPDIPGLSFSEDVVYQGGAVGFVPFSGTTVIGNRNFPYNGLVDIYFEEAVESLAIWVADGPFTNVKLEGYDPNGLLLDTVIAPLDLGSGFLGFSQAGAQFASIRLQTLAPDDDDAYYDQLTLGFIPTGEEIPEPSSIALLALAMLGASGARKRRLQV